MEAKYDKIHGLLSLGSYPKDYDRTQRQNLRRYASKFSLRDGELFFGTRRAIRGKEEARSIFEEFHASPMGGHTGIHKTRSALASRFYWFGMSVDIEKWIQECDQCQKMGKPLTAVQPLQCIKLKTSKPDSDPKKSKEKHKKLITSRPDSDLRKPKEKHKQNAACLLAPDNLESTTVHDFQPAMAAPCGSASVGNSWNKIVHKSAFTLITELGSSDQTAVKAEAGFDFPIVSELQMATLETDIKPVDEEKLITGLGSSDQTAVKVEAGFDFPIVSELQTATLETDIKPVDEEKLSHQPAFSSQVAVKVEAGFDLPIFSEPQTATLESDTKPIDQEKVVIDLRPMQLTTDRLYDRLVTTGKRFPAERVSSIPPAKKARKAIDLDTKMMVIKQHEGGKKVNAIARAMKLSHSTVSTILKDKERICEAVKGSAPMRSTVITKQRTGPIHEMEKLLHVWMEDQIAKRTPLSLFTIQTKARSLFQTLKARAGEDYSQEFVASTGWFKRFKKRFELHNIRVTGEAASADEGARKFTKILDEIIADEGYIGEQIFNVDETGLFWKRMPARTYIHKEAKSMPGFKSFKDRLTLLLGGNIAGFKLKPFLIYHSQNPRAFRNVNKHTLPVYFRSNHKAWMTQALFEDWFMNCFIPQVREYCLEKQIPFKILLLLDNAPGHPPHLADFHPDVKVVFLPPNTSPLIQPMDQGSIATFKANYLRTTFSQAMAAIDADPEVSLRDFWKQYNILQCIKNIATAWDAVTEKCMNGIWKNCVKRYVNTFAGFDSEKELDVIRDKIVNLAKNLSLDCEMEDVKELLDQESGELTNEELIELEEERRQAEEEEEEEEPRRMFTTKGLSEGFSQLNKLLAHFEAMDPNIERFARIERMVHDALRPYREIYEEKKKQTIQTRLTMFMKRANPPASPSAATADDDVDDPQPSTSHASGH
ncbi:tigger transposable element-derived protein 1-like isoform X4 [Neoarius graeffei]|uniref:tigger transposable element-derived protein 1-like isoform X4 n=1 Tax=Neoarius graeffei TaxID=443677 RepID=UPI00298CC748|nr:tigger transposable element-derived protein 1-like isoform X4 [Neoarius graeffei]